MNVILFDDDARNHLLPLTFTRPVAEIRIGILTIREKWEKYLKTKCSYFTEKYLSEKFPIKISNSNLLINGGILPDKKLVKEILSLKQNQALVTNNFLIACVLSSKETEKFDPIKTVSLKTFGYSDSFTKINFPWDIFSKNGEALIADFPLLTKGKKSSPISKTNKILGTNIFIEKGAKIECAVLNSTTGPIYIGKEAEVMEGSIIRGPFALCEHSALKLGAKIYGPTTIGPYCKVGGEVNNSVIFGYSNKAHDGFLGNAVLGEWCNIGADSNNSNLKNNYEKVKIWSYVKNGFAETGLQFCGLIMGDHSKCGINTMFNTGTVVGVSSNIFGDGFPRNFIPSFQWGGSQGFTEYKINKAIQTAELVYARREMLFDDTEKKIFQHLYNLTYPENTK